MGKSQDCFYPINFLFPKESNSGLLLAKQYHDCKTEHGCSS
jgi:hypothetical protein